MPDPRFYAVAGPFTLAEIAQVVEAELTAGANPERRVSDVAPLSHATPEHLSFLVNSKYVDAFAACSAGACIAPAKLADRAPAEVAVLTSENPYKSFALAAQLFYPGSGAGAWDAPGGGDPTRRRISARSVVSRPVP